MSIIESPRPDTELEELKAERSYYRDILDDLADQANLYSANAFEQLKNHISSNSTVTEYTQQIYYTVTGRRRKSTLKDWLLWLLWFPKDVVEENVFTAQDIVSTIFKFQYSGYDQIEIIQKRGDKEY
jgi:hypothetical protein